MTDSESHTFTERRAEDRWPTAIIRRNSGPSSPIHVKSSLSRTCAQRPSDSAGRLGQTDVQQQRTMVKRQVRMISLVPRPSGGDVQPAVSVLLLEVLFMTSEQTGLTADK